MISYVTKKAKDPAKAIQIYTYLLSDEGQKLMNYGIEGETYKVNDSGKIEFLPEIKDLQLNNADKFKKITGWANLCSLDMTVIKR